MHIATSWEIPDDLMNELACTIITTAVEGGINYWASVSDYRWLSEEPPFARVTVHDSEDGEQGPWQIDAAKMTEALVKIVNGDIKPFYNQGYSTTFRERLINLFDQVKRNPDLRLLDADFDFDADDADAAMQTACFDGEIVYG